MYTRRGGCKAVWKVKMRWKILLFFISIIAIGIIKFLKWQIDLTWHVDASLHLDPSCWSVCMCIVTRQHYFWTSLHMEPSCMTKRESKIMNFYLSIINKISQFISTWFARYIYVALDVAKPKDVCVSILWRGERQREMRARVNDLGRSNLHTLSIPKLADI